MGPDATPSATWHILTSTMIRAVAYDPGERVLRVRFGNGTTYRYLDVPPEVVETLLDPPDGSPGRYFNETIRDGFDYEEEPHRR
jgi:hypothetical protein